MTTRWPIKMYHQGVQPVCLKPKLLLGAARPGEVAMDTLLLGPPISASVTT